MYGAGVLNVTADEDGTFSATINLKSQNPPPKAGETLIFDAVWIGPTRERLKAAAETQIQYSKHTVSITTSLPNDKLVPMQEFSIVSKVEVDANESLPAATSLNVRPPLSHMHGTSYLTASCSIGHVN
jgi:hypothetical protein